jgi:para-nitrobenzyl esterase
MARQFLCTSTEPVVQTKAGKLRGFQLDGIYTFQGIRYGEAKRFQAPHPVSPWEGIKDALSYGCISPLLDTPSPQGEVMIPHLFWPENENCQYLNVWSKSLDKSAKFPVMVWLHGGGYSAGSSIEQVA